MPLTGIFNPPAEGDTTDRTEAKPAKPKRLAPCSRRLTEDERLRLTAEAGGAPLGSYIKAKVLGDAPIRLRRTGIEIEDRASLAKLLSLLSLLGASRIANNLNQLAHLANIGALPLTSETEAELYAAFGDVRDMRGLLLEALGLKSDLARP